MFTTSFRVKGAVGTVFILIFLTIVPQALSGTYESCKTCVDWGNPSCPSTVVCGVNNDECFYSLQSQFQGSVECDTFYCWYDGRDTIKPDCIDYCGSQGHCCCDGTAVCSATGWRCEYNKENVECCDNEDCPEGYKCENNDCTKRECVCNWEYGGCGEGDCSPTERRRVYTCDPPNCDPDDGKVECVYDSSCEEETPPSTTTTSGYTCSDLGCYDTQSACESACLCPCKKC